MTLLVGPSSTDPAPPGAAHGEPSGDDAPPATRDRVLALDVLRGIAILGTLATNIGAFVFITREPVISGTAQTVIGFAYGLVTNGYWIGLLTIMFGIGLMIQRESAVRRGEPWLGSYPWRAVLLIVEGFLNYLFVVPFDVLMGYGLTALVICVVLTTPRRVQNVVLALGLVAHVAHLVYVSVRDNAMFERFSRTDERGRLARDKLLDEFGGGVTGDLSMGYWATVQMNIDMFWSGGRAEIPIMFLMGIGVFLIGARLWEAGLFTRDGARLRKRVMWVGLGIGLPLDWGMRTWQTFGESAPWWSHTFVRYGTATVVAFGVLALVAHFYAGRERTGRVGSMLALVGRMALSTYLLQNILGVVLFSTFALDLGSKVPFSLGILDLVIGTALIGAILIVFAKLWLSRFERGPMESISHAAHGWLVRNTTERVLARRRAKLVAPADHG